MKTAPMSGSSWQPSHKPPYSITGFVLVWALQIPWLSMIFLWPFPVFQDLRFSCQFQKVTTFTCFRAFFDRKKFNRYKLGRSPKRMPFTLLNYSSLSYTVLAFSSAVNNLSNRTSIFHVFQGPTIKFHDFPGLEMKFLNSMTFQVFHDLYEPCVHLCK